MNAQETRHELIRTIHRFRRLNLSAIFGPMTRGEFFVLEILLHHQHCEPGGGVYVSELADKLEVSPPAVSRMLRHMEENHWIERRVEQSDRRNTLVVATEEGISARQQTDDHLVRYSDHLISAMGAEEMATLLLLWNQLIGAMELEVKTQKKERHT